jgi:transmembrane sensor
MDRPRAKLNTQIYEEASAWFVECRAGDLDESGRREFDRWLRKSPENLSAYLEIAAIWTEGSTLDPNEKWDVESLIAESRGQSDNVVSLPETSADPEFQESVPPTEAVTSRSRRRLTRRPLFLAAAASITALGLVGLWVSYTQLAPEYSTATGEQRSIVLADGSTVSMNSRSRIRVRYSEGERAVDLLKGQVLFHVAKDKSRPFLVSADGTRVRAVGTQFDVYEKHEGTRVTVLEGQVAVLAPPASASPSNAGSAEPKKPDTARLATILVSAGEQLTVTPKLTQKSDHPNMAAATAWTQRQIIFDSATLSEVAEEFNRYNERQLVIEDPSLNDFHISGVFSSTDPDSLIRFLRMRPGINVSEDGSVIRISQNI